jgi:hypothetical protein
MYFKYKNIMICVIKIENETLTSNKCMHRMEAMGIGTIAGMLKIVGVAVSVGGTMLISLCKGKTLHLWNPIFHHHNEESTEVASYQLRGTILLLVPNSGNPIFFSKKKKTVAQMCSAFSHCTRSLRFSKCIHTNIGLPWQHSWLEDFRQQLLEWYSGETVALGR